MKRATVIFALATSLLLQAQPGLGASLYDVVVDKLIVRYGLDTAASTVEVLKGQLPDQAVEPSHVSIQPLFQREPAGLVSLVAIVTGTDGSIHRGQFNLRVRRFSEVAVMTSALKLHDEITTDKLEIKRMDVTSLREQPITSLDAIHGSRTKRNLAAGQILTVEATETAPDIEVGREVTITFEEKSFTITTRGLAMQTGRRGEKIRVKNLASGKTVFARVTGEREVHVEL